MRKTGVAGVYLLTILVLSLFIGIGFNCPVGALKAQDSYEIVVPLSDSRGGDRIYLNNNAKIADLQQSQPITHRSFSNVSSYSALEVARFFALPGEHITELTSVESSNNKVYKLFKLREGIIIPVGQDNSVPGRSRIYGLILAYKVRYAITPELISKTEKTYRIARAIAQMAENVYPYAERAATWLEENKNNFLVRDVMDAILSSFGLDFETALTITLAVRDTMKFITDNVGPIASAANLVLKRYEQITHSSRIMEAPSIDLIKSIKELGDAIVNVADALKMKYEETIGKYIKIFNVIYEKAPIDIVKKLAGYVLDFDTKVRGYIHSLKQYGNEYTILHSRLTSAAKITTDRTVQRLESITRKYVDETASLISGWREVAEYVKDRGGKEVYFEKSIQRAEEKLSEAAGYIGNDYFKAIILSKESERDILKSIEEGYKIVSATMLSELTELTSVISDCMSLNLDFLNLSGAQSLLLKAKVQYAKGKSQFMNGDYKGYVDSMKEIIASLTQAEEEIESSINSALSYFSANVTKFEQDISNAKSIPFIDLANAQDTLSELKNAYRLALSELRNKNYARALKIIKQALLKIDEGKEQLKVAIEGAHRITFIVIGVIIVCIIPIGWVLKTRKIIMFKRKPKIIARRPGKPSAPEPLRRPPVRASVQICPNCGAFIWPGDKYCPQCGMKVKIEGKRLPRPKLNVNELLALFPEYVKPLLKACMLLSLLALGAFTLLIYGGSFVFTDLLVMLMVILSSVVLVIYGGRAAQLAALKGYRRKEKIMRNVCYLTAELLILFYLSRYLVYASLIPVGGILTLFWLLAILILVALHSYKILR